MGLIGPSVLELEPGPKKRLTAAKYSHSRGIEDNLLTWDWLWSSHVYHVQILPTSAHLQKRHGGLLGQAERRGVINSGLELANVMYSVIYCTCICDLSRCIHFP